MQKTPVVCLVVVVIALLVLFALERKGDVKASFNVLGSGFSLEATDRK